MYPAASLTISRSPISADDVVVRPARRRRAIPGRRSDLRRPPSATGRQSLPGTRNVGQSLPPHFRDFSRGGRHRMRGRGIQATRLVGFPGKTNENTTSAYPSSSFSFVDQARANKSRTFGRRPCRLTGSSLQTSPGRGVRIRTPRAAIGSVSSRRSGLSLRLS